MSAAATNGGGRRPDASFRRSRAGRTLVALLAVGSVAVTAAGAQPLDGGSGTPPTDVFAGILL